MTSDPWGRVDDDGTVYVRTADGERVIGSWQAGSPDEALAFFRRKFDELQTEVDLLEQRLGRGAVSPEQAAKQVQHLRDSVVTAAAIGDLDSLAARLDGLVPAIDHRRAELREEREQQRAQTRARKEELVAEAEEIAENGTRWKAGGDRIREIIDTWKTLDRLDRAGDQALWKRLAAARNAFAKRRRRYFQDLASHQEEARTAKERIVKEAESLRDSTEWGPTSGQFRELMNQWRAAGRADREADQQLWQRFKAAQDTFFSARSAAFEQRDSEQRQNLERKIALCDEAERLLPVTDLAAARSALRDLHERWNEAGPVPRAERGQVESRLRRVEDAVREAEEREWQRTNPEARARAEATVNQLRESIEKLEATAESAETSGRMRDAEDARTAAAARREWLAEAERTLAEFS
ncbi:MAG: DUF349 domain-containing protein [Streptosporangiales bacterium]|nr:DUF349 domain-containing protein [Streptosporangiales bacterium]MBO0892209.1 DUF349 domain-containing protein [Acidothermales bacterium]